MPFKKLLAVLAAVAWLSGCKTVAVHFGNQLDDQYPFDASASKAAVILGIGLTHESDRVGMFMMRENWTAAWVRVADGKPAKGDVIRAVRTHCAVFAKERRVPCEEDHQKAMRQVFIVEPGEYMLSAVSRSGVVTQFLGGSDSMFTSSDVEKKKAANKIPWFEVKAGEIAYVGDFMFDITDDKARLREVAYDEDAARKTLMLFPEIKGDLAVRQLSGGTDYTKLSPPPEPLDPALTPYEVTGSHDKNRKAAELTALKNVVLAVRERNHRMFRILDVRTKQRTMSRHGQVVSTTWDVTMEIVSATEEEATRIGGKWRRVAPQG